MKRLLLSFCMLVIAIGTWAAKAQGEPVVVKQSDGTQLTVIGYGDEDYHWYTTTDGVLLAHVGRSYFVASLDAEGLLTATSQLAHEPSLRSASERELVNAQSVNRPLFFSKVPQRKQVAMQRRITIGSSSPAYFPHMGSPKTLIILVQFNDLSFTVNDPLKSFGDYMNGEHPLEDYGYREDRNYGSVREYFTDMSEGLFTPQFDVYGPVTLSNSWTYYGKDPDSSTSDYSSRIQELMKEACSAIDADVDFKQYDSNDDGYADLVYIVYAGYAQSISGNSSDCIWPKSGTMSGGTYDGIKVSRYGLNNELNYYDGREFSSPPYKRINGIGLFCHEFSHTLGLPDLYPTGGTGRTVDNQTMEYWDVMDGGEYTDNGYTPTPYTPWEKEVMGWIELEELINSPQKVLLAEGQSYKISSDANNEYVILHNLQNSQWASKLLGHGMMVYRIDYSNSNGTPRETVNMGDSPNNIGGKPGITLMPADGILINYYRMYGTNEENKTADKPYSYSEYIQSHYGDPYPGSTGVEKIDKFTLNRCTIKRPLYNIKEVDGTITFDFLEDFEPDGIITAVAESAVDPSDLYDLSGRKIVSRKLDRGIYIRDGKKFVVK